jgi:tetratricopeptide (TPR) repeat protein
MFTDQSGDPVTLANEAASRAWLATVEGVLAHAADAPVHLAGALEADPDFALGHATRGLLLLTLARAELVATARACLDQARAAMARRPVSWREGMVAEALRHWLDGHPRRAAETLEAILSLHPGDALAAKLGHAIRFMLGDRLEMLAALSRSLPRVQSDHPLAGYLHGCHAFALEESGHFAEAERAGRMAVELAPRDIWGRHAVAHVMEMQGRVDEGLAWLADGRHRAHANNLRFHLSWHAALFRLERGETAEALRLYDDEVRAESTDDFRDIANGASLLARLEFEGIDVGGRWEELAVHAERRVSDGQLVFADLHYLLALLGAGRWESAGALAGGLATDALPGRAGGRAAPADVGVSVALGLMALKAGDHREAVRRLGAARRNLTVVGGSNAQRDVFEQAYIESLIGAGEHEQAATVLAARIARRGGSNRYAAKRLLRLSSGAPIRVAALAIAATPLATTH